MRRARLTTYSALGVLFAFVIAVIVLLTVDLGIFAPRIERTLSQRLGRQVAIDGDLSLLLGSTISVVATDVRIAAVEWAEEPDFASAALLEFELVTDSLWSGPIEIQQLRIDELTLHLERSDEGEDSWTFQEQDEDSPAEAEDRLPVIIRDLALHDVLLTYDGNSAMPRLQFALANVRGVENTNGNLEFTSDGRLNDTDLNVHAEIGPVEDLVLLRNTEFSVAGSLGEVAISGEGQIENLLAPKKPRGVLTITGPNAEYLTDILGITPITTGPLDLDASIKLSGDQLATSIRGAFGEFDIDAKGRFLELGNLDGIDLRLLASGPDASAVAALAGLKDLPSHAFTVDAAIGSEDGDLVVERVSVELGATSLGVSGRFPAFPSPVGAVATLTLAGPELGEYSSLLGLPGALTGSFDVALNLAELPGGDASLTVSAESKDVKLSVEGTIADTEGHAGSRFDVSGQGKSFRPVGRAIGFDAAPDVPYNFQGTLSLADNNIVLDQGSASLGSDDIDVSGFLGYQPLEKDTDVGFEVIGPDIASTLRAWGYATGRLPPERFSVTGNLQSAKDHFELADIRASIGDADGFTIALNGQLSAETDLVGSAFHVEAKGPNLAALTDVLEIPNVPVAEFDIRARVERVSEGWAFDDGEAVIGNTNLKGQGLIGEEPLARDTTFEVSASSSNLKTILADMGISNDIVPGAAADVTISVRAQRDYFELSELTLSLPTTTIEASGQLGESLELEGSSLAVDVTGSDFAYLLPDSGAYSGLAKPFDMSGQVRMDDETVWIDELEITIENARVTGELAFGRLPTAARGRFSIDATAPNLERLTPRFDRVRQGRKVPMTLRARGSWADTLWIFDELHLQLSNDSLIANGRITGPPDFGATDLEVDWQISDMSNYDILTGYSWPEEAAHLNFRLSGIPGRLNLDHLTATAGRSDFAGNFRILSGEPMSLEASFRSQTLDIRHYLVPPPKAEESRKPESVSKNQRMIPDTAVDLDFLKALNAQVDFQVDALRLPRGVLRDVALAGSIDSGALRVDRFSLNGFKDGSLSGGLQLAPHDDGAKFAMNLNGQNVSLGFIVKDFKDMQYLPQYDIDTSVEMSGATIREMAASLDGNLRLVAGAGRVTATALHYFTSDLFSTLLNALNPFSKADSETDITCAVVLLDAKDGLVKGSPAYVMQSEKVDVFGDLELDLKTEEINIQVKTVAQKGLGFSVTDMINPYTQITGTLADPDLSLDPKGTIIEGGAAVITAGISIAVTRFAERFLSEDDQCGKALREAE